MSTQHTMARPGAQAATQAATQATTQATLKDINPGQRCKVEFLAGAGAIRRRIKDMGVTKGTEVQVRKVAPVGDPMEGTGRGFELTLRSSEAALIAVAPLA